MEGRSRLRNFHYPQFLLPIRLISFIMESVMARIKRKRCRRGKAKSDLSEQLKCVNLNAAGVDVGAENNFVAVPEGRDENSVPSRAT